MASINELLSFANIGWLQNLVQNPIIIIQWVLFIIGLASLCFALLKYYNFQSSILSKIMIIDERSGTRKIIYDVILKKEYKSGKKYLVTHKTNKVIDHFPRNVIFTTKGKKDLWVGYLDKNGFIHPCDFDAYKQIIEKVQGQFIIKKVPSFITIPQELADFYQRATEDRVEKNRVLSKWDKLNAAIIISACVMGTIMIIVAMSIVK